MSAGRFALRTKLILFAAMTERPTKANVICITKLVSKTNPFLSNTKANVITQRQQQKVKVAIMMTIRIPIPMEMIQS